MIVASFTKAAALEITGRKLPINRDQVGTLHALAYRAIGRPEVADDEALADWNALYPSLALSGGFSAMDEAGYDRRGGTDGDDLMAEVEVLRARMRKWETWPVRTKSFWTRWNDWKTKNGLIDFTEMIERALSETEEAPGAPAVGFFDEVQDFSPLELALVRRWGRSMDRVILAGDDDQSIYGFRGATPDAFLSPAIPEEQKRLLRESHRIPSEVHRVSDAWIKHLTRREPKEYFPRDAEGSVAFKDLQWTDPEPFVRTIQQKVDEGKSVMVLATCSFMLDRVKHEMRAQGVPFGNRWRRKRYDWNPLRGGRGVSSVEKLLAYLVIDENMFGVASHLWHGGDVKRWASAVKKKGIFIPGVNARIEGLPDRELRYEEVASLFLSEDDLEAAVTPDINWFSKNLLAGSRQAMEYPIRVVRTHGGQALVDEPPVTLGTIHSTKGAEADCVILIPDVSAAGMREWEAGGDHRDAIIRQMYVGMTRAKEDLIFVGPASPRAIDPILMMGRRQ